MHASAGAANTEADAAHSGTDARQRGWFWHWNSMVTQYAPLLGLKGIGLLNSYTVWTDRREHSPYHGYAFPSQAAEAAFYGEDRAELITINKILVALDLIEIRKEMVQRTDEQGRRWRVPHNFYRVKDRADGLDLRSADVLRVVELAAADKAVFRYIRRIFSSKFAPIDRDNAWHAILIELASQPAWQMLQAQAAELEARNSARTKAGHRQRARHSEAAPTENLSADMTSGQLDGMVFFNTEHEREESDDSEPSVATTSTGSTPFVGGSNNGFELGVGETNAGSRPERLSSVAETNDATRNSVEPSNTTYNQALTTTTTTAQAVDARAQTPDSAVDFPAASAILEESPLVTESALGRAPAARGAATKWDAHHPGSGGPLGDPSALVVSLFEAANDRHASKLERLLLSELELAAAAPAHAAGASGADWVAAALREAVASGSAFVAPKRIREIINRWAAEGAGPAGRLSSATAGGAQAARQPARRATAIWQRALATIRVTVDDSTFDRLLASSAIQELRDGNAVVRVATASAADKLSHEYRALVERSLSQAAGQPVTVRFVADAPIPSAEEVVPGSPPDELRLIIAAGDAERGRQLWTATLATLGTRLTAADRARLEAVVPLGQDADGALLLGVPNRLAARLISGRCQAAISDALADVLGARYALQTVERSSWTISD